MQNEVDAGFTMGRGVVAPTTLESSVKNKGAYTREIVFREIFEEKIEEQFAGGLLW